MTHSHSRSTKKDDRRRRNGSIELLRFLFTSIIIFFHINLDLWEQQKVIATIHGFPVTFFKHGNIGVEFFFLVTGWLMAGSVYAKGQSPQAGTTWRALAGETVQFVGHKARAILPYYLTACALTPLVRALTDRALTTEYFVLRLPSLLFLQRIGLGKPFIGCTWYLSSMLLALAFAYPLCRRFYRIYTHLAGPVLGFLLLWVILAQTGSLGDIQDWFYFTYKTNVRAFAEISAGAAAFECSRFLQTCFQHINSPQVQSLQTDSRHTKSLQVQFQPADSPQTKSLHTGFLRSTKDHSTKLRILLTTAAILCLALSIAYMCSALPGTYALGVFVLLFLAVTIVFSGEGYLSRAGIFDHALFMYLGEISLPMYVSQTLLRMLVPHWFGGWAQWSQCLLIYLGISAFAILLHTLLRQIRSRSGFLQPRKTASSST